MQPSTCVALQVCYKGATPEGIAEMVDMSADEVNDILRGDEGVRALPAGSMMQAIEDTCSRLRAALRPAGDCSCSKKKAL